MSDEYNYDFYDPYEDELRMEAERNWMIGTSKINKGQVDQGISSLKKAINSFVDIGDYFPIVESIQELVDVEWETSKKIQIHDFLMDVMRQFQKLKVYDVLAQLHLDLANFEFKIFEYGLAAQNYNDAANNFFEDPTEDSRKMCLLMHIQSAFCYERIGKLKRAEKELFDGIFRINLSTINIKVIEDQVQTLLKKEKFEKVILKLTELVNFFHRCLQQILEIEDQTISTIKALAYTRLSHQIADYNLIVICCHKVLSNPNSMIKLADESIKFLSDSIKISILQINNGKSHKALLKQVSFDIFLLQFLQEFTDHQIEDPNVFIKQLVESAQDEIKKYSFFRFTQDLYDFNISKILPYASDIKLGRIEKFRWFLEKNL